MELDDLLITRGLSSRKSDLRMNGMGNLESVQGMEWLNQEGTVSAYLLRNPEIRT